MHLDESYDYKESAEDKTCNQQFGVKFRLFGLLAKFNLASNMEDEF